LVLAPKEANAKTQAQKEKDLIAEALAAAQRGDKKALENAANNLKNLNDLLASNLRDQALKSDDPKQTKKLIDNTNALEDVLKQFLEDSNKLANNPKDAAANNRAKQDAERFESVMTLLNFQTGTSPSPSPWCY
jgi:ABC-type transporter Mla subunit MlaD